MTALHNAFPCKGRSSVTRVLRIKGQMGVHRSPGGPTGWNADCDGRQIMPRSNRRALRYAVPAARRTRGRRVRGVQVGILPT
jgi:hypothetical protein